MLDVMVNYFDSLFDNSNNNKSILWENNIIYKNSFNYPDECTWKNKKISNWNNPVYKY